MNERQKRLHEVYDYLLSVGKIHSETDFASSLGRTYDSLNRAFNGNEKYLTDRLFMAISKTYLGIFNNNYLLKGEGPMCATEVPCNQTLPNNPQEVAYLKEMLADKNEIIALLKARVQELEKEITALTGKSFEKTA